MTPLTLFFLRSNFHRLSFFGTRYVNKLELLQDKTVNVWTYDILARPTVSINAPVDAFKYGAFNDQGDYYKFKIRGHRWFFIMDKKGSVPYVASILQAGPIHACNLT